jgi:hypothetical protein
MSVILIVNLHLNVALIANSNPAQDISQDNDQWKAPADGVKPQFDPFFRHKGDYQNSEQVQPYSRQKSKLSHVTLLDDGNCVTFT